MAKKEATSNICYKCKRDASDKIPGGLSDGMSPKDFDQKKLSQGIKIELEHTSDKEIAQEIAMDHLVEDKDYYDKLKIIESSNKEATPVEVYAPWGPVDNVEQVRYPKNKKENKDMKEKNDNSMLSEIESLRARGAAILTNLEKENPDYKKYQEKLERYLRKNY